MPQAVHQLLSQAVISDLTHGICRKSHEWVDNRKFVFETVEVILRLMWSFGRGLQRIMTQYVLEMR